MVGDPPAGVDVREKSGHPSLAALLHTLSPACTWQNRGSGGRDQSIPTQSTEKGAVALPEQGSSCALMLPFFLGIYSDIKCLPYVNPCFIFESLIFTIQIG